MNAVRNVFQLRSLSVALPVAAFTFVALGGISAFAAALPGTVNQASEIRLQTHEQFPWELPSGLERVAIANPEVADLLMLKGRRQALLIGKAPGQTTLLVWLRGQASPQRYNVQVLGAVQGELLQDSPAKLTVQDNRALLQGNAGSMEQHEQLREAATAAVGEKGSLTDASSVDGGSVVQVEVKVVEFNKTAMRSIGLNLAKSNGNGAFTYGLFSPSTLTSVSNTTSSGTTSSTTTGGTTSLGGLNFVSQQPISSAFNLVLSSASHSLFSNLSLLQSNGLARILAEPTLVALSGQSASFLAGGELPIPEPQGLGTTTITYKTFGIGLTVTPTVLSPGRIALKVAPEASDLDYTNAVTLNGVSVPAISTRRADTTVQLGDGESYVIGGLVSSSTTSNVAMVPLLGQIPIIGAFFRNMNYSRTDKELVFVVTPHLVKPLAPNTKIPLPGEQEEKAHMPVWGAWLLYPAGSDQLPGFSR